MQVQIFGTRKCRNTEKALRFFKERSIALHFVDLNDKGIAKGELTNILRSVSIDDLIDKDGKEWKSAGLDYMIFDPEEKILENPLILKTPIVRFGPKASAGYQPELWKDWQKSEGK